MSKKIFFTALVVVSLAVASCAPSATTLTTTRNSTTTVTQPGGGSTVTVTQPVTFTPPSVTVTVTQPPTATATQTATPTAGATSTTALPAGTVTTTAAQLAAAGAARYNDSCVQTYCHHKFGDGGEDEFSQFRLSYFSDAQDMFKFTKSFMHTPDTQLFLTDQQYTEVIAFLLLQNKTVQDNTPFGLANLGSFKLGGTARTTAGALAEGGLLRYNDSCAQTYCHDKWEAGGMNDFNRTRLNYFDNAQDMLNFIKSFMHHPDTKQELTDEQYLQILAYILAMNGTVKPTDSFGLSNLPNITFR